MKTHHAIAVIAIAIITSGVYLFFGDYPTSEQIKNKLESIVSHPDLCSQSNSKAFELLKLINPSGQILRLKEKTNAMPIRVDYYIEDNEGRVIAELIYRVDSGCQGIRVNKIIRKPE